MLRTHRYAVGAIRSLLFIALFVMALAAAPATPVFAGTGSFSTTGSMNFARDGHTAVLLQNGQVLVVDGWNFTNGFMTSAELYNPAKGKWTLTGSNSVSRSGDGAVLLPNGEVLLAGGSDMNATGTPTLTSAELYNPSTGTWSATGSMTTPRTRFALVLLQNGQVLAAGGEQAPGSTTPSTAELYNPATGTWTATGSMTQAASGGAILLPNGDVLVADVDIYDPSTGTFTALSSPAPSGAGGPVGLVLNGSVLTYSGSTIVGGAIFAPSTSQWTTYGPPPCDVPDQTCGSGAALLSNGILLVAGGTTTVNAQPYPITETNGLAALFDPSSLTWTTTGSLKKDRIGQTMTLLPNGQVLVAGGESYDKSAGALRPIANAELYTP